MPWTPPDDEELQPACLHCGAPFTVAELSAARADLADDQSCIVPCDSCGAENEMQAQPRGGFDAQPAPRVLRIVRKPK